MNELCSLCEYGISVSKEQQLKIISIAQRNLEYIKEMEEHFFNK